MDKNSFYSNLSSITGRFNSLSWPLANKDPVDVITLPENYVALARQLDTLKNVQTNLVKITQTQFPLQMHSNNSGILEKSAGSNGPNSWAWSTSGPPTPYHAMAVAFSQCGLEIGVEEPIGSSLYKVATIQQKIGDARLVMDQKLSTDVVQPLNVNLNTNIRYIEKARREVDQLLSQLNYARGRHMNAGLDPGPELEFELTTAQANYDQALKKTTRLMANVLEAPDTIKIMAQLVQIQLAYHQEAFQLLTDIFPQVHDLAAAHEALRSLPPDPSLTNSIHSGSGSGSSSLSPTLNKSQPLADISDCSPGSPLATPPLSPSIATADNITEECLSPSSASITTITTQPPS